MKMDVEGVIDTFVCMGYHDANGGKRKYKEEVQNRGMDTFVVEEK